MGSTNGEHLGFDLSHIFSGQRRALIGIKPRGDAAPTGEGARDFPRTTEGTHHPRVGEEEAVLRWWRAGFEMGEEGLLRPNTWTVEEGNLAKRARPPAPTHSRAANMGPTKALRLGRCASARVRKAASADPTSLERQRPQPHDRGGSSTPNERAGASGLKARCRAKPPNRRLRQGLERCPNGPCPVQIRQEEAEPFHKTGEAHVARLTHFLHRSMQVFQAPIEVACSVGDARSASLRAA